MGKLSLLKHKITAADIKWPCKLDEEFKQKILSIATPVTNLPTSESSMNNPYFKGIYYIHTGLSYLCVTTLDLKPLNCVVFGERSWLGSLFMYNHSELPLHVGEIESGDILFFPKKKIQLLCSETDQTHRWLFHIASFNSPKFFQAQTIPQYNKEVRIIYYLLELGRQTNKIEGALPKIKITQQQLSELCGVARPSVNQVLKGLQLANIIKVERGNIYLHDLQGLSEKIADVNLTFHNPSQMFTLNDKN